MHLFFLECSLWNNHRHMVRHFLLKLNWWQTRFPHKRWQDSKPLPFKLLSVLWLKYQEQTEDINRMKSVNRQQSSWYFNMYKCIISISIFIVALCNLNLKKMFRLQMQWIEPEFVAASGAISDSQMAVILTGQVLQVLQLCSRWLCSVDLIPCGHCEASAWFQCFSKLSDCPLSPPRKIAPAGFT